MKNTMLPVMIFFFLTLLAVSPVAGQEAVKNTAIKDKALPITVGETDKDKLIREKSISPAMKRLIIQMRKLSNDLGVTCTYCHLPENYKSDDKRAKTSAKKMLTMVKFLDDKFFSYPGARKTSCRNCHRGELKVDY